jgi:hypothetical protein
VTLVRVAILRVLFLPWISKDLVLLDADEVQSIPDVSGQALQVRWDGLCSIIATQYSGKVFQQTGFELLPRTRYRS